MSDWVIGTFYPLVRTEKLACLFVTIMVFLTCNEKSIWRGNGWRGIILVQRLDYGIGQGSAQIFFCKKYFQLRSSFFRC